MPVYMVYVCHSVSDRAQLEKYWASIAPTLQGHSVKYLAAYTPFEVLEGEKVEGVFVAEWPSMEAAKAWYDSPGYQAIRPPAPQIRALYYSAHRLPSCLFVERSYRAKNQRPAAPETRESPGA